MFVAFNRCASCVTSANDAGFQIFGVPPDSTFRQLRSDTTLGAISVVAMLDNTPLLVVVGSSRGTQQQQQTGTHRFLQLYDTNRHEVLTSMHFDTAILNVRMNIKRLVVILERTTHIFDLNTLAPLPQIRSTQPLNKTGLGALSDLTTAGKCYFAFPYSDREGRGDIVVIEAVEQRESTILPAHRHPIVAVEICSSGSRIATCSISGTTIKVFSNPNSQLLFQFRRGQRQALVYCLAFSRNGDLLAVSSDSGTLHLFSCNEGGGTGGFEGIRSFAKIAVRDPKLKTLCAISENNKILSVVSVPAQAGQRCTIVQYLIEQNCKLTAEYPLCCSIFERKSYKIKISPFFAVSHIKETKIVLLWFFFE